MKLDRRTVLTGLAALPAARLQPDGSIQIPFRHDGGMVVVEVVIEDQPALAAIDNGAAFSVLDQGFARAMNIVGVGRMRLNGAPVRIAASVGVTLGGRRIATSPAISNLAGVSASVGQPIALLLGYELFAAWTVHFDFDGGVMTLHGRAFDGPPDVPAIALAALPGRKFAAPLKIGRQTIPAMVDLGAAAALMVSSSLAERLDLSRRQPQTTAGAQAFIGDQPKLFVSRLLTAPPMQFADLTLRDMPLEILAPDEPVFSRYGATLGAPVLTRYELWLDLPGRRLWARPNRRAHSAFEKDRIGLQGYVADGAFRIMHVRERSPAFRAGLSTRDLVVAVNQRPAGELIAELKYGAPAGKAYDLRLSDGRTVSLVAADFY